MMCYTYVAAWAVIGGVFMPESSEAIELFKSDTCRIVLTRDPDGLLAAADRATAISHEALNWLVGRSEGDHAAALSSVTKAIVAERKKKADINPVLIFEGHGKVAATVDNDRPPGREAFTVVFDAVDKRELRAVHRPAIEAMKLALALESESPSRFTALSDSIYLNDEGGKTVYSLTFSGSAEGSVATSLTPEMLSRIAERYESLLTRQDLERVQRLFSEMADLESDRLKVFLFGWAALEILVKKAFRIYREAGLAPLASAGSLTLRNQFRAVSAVLFPDAPETAVENDCEGFRRLKDVRDRFYHGEEFSEKDLPVHDLAALLQKYLVACVEAAQASSR